MIIKKSLTLIIFIILFLSNLFLAKAEEGECLLPKDLSKSNSVAYYVRLINGDILTGNIIDIESTSKGDAVRLKTIIGTSTIYACEIAEIAPVLQQYRHKHRVFIQPTAYPIGNDHFIANYELAAFYGGFGISDFLSVTMARTFLPLQRGNNQFSDLNIKVSPQDMAFSTSDGNIAVAAGLNLSFANDINRMIHAYTVVSYTGNTRKSTLNMVMFYKAGTKDFTQVKVFNEYYDFNYENGALGIGIGLDTRISKRHDLRIIGELWNANITKQTHSAFMLGLRLSNSMFSADFGIAASTQPFILPVINFVWTPFSI